MPESEKQQSEQPESGLYDAILALQAEAPKLAKDAENPHFKSKYASLDGIVEKVGPLLVKHDLVWTTEPTFIREFDGSSTPIPALRYTLTHAPSGESLEGTMPLLPTKPDPQGLGSALTYARRYSICSVLNLVGEDDDDGNAASRQEAAPVSGPPNGPGASNEDHTALSDALVLLFDGAVEPAKAAYDAITEISGGYLPQPVAASIVDLSQRLQAPS